MTMQERYTAAGLPLPSVEEVEAYSLRQHDQMMAAHEVLDDLGAAWSLDLVERMEAVLYEQKLRIEELLEENSRLLAQMQPLRRAS